MPRPLPRWLSTLFGLLIIAVVGSVVFFSINVIRLVSNSTTPAGLSFPRIATNNKTIFLIVMENHNWSDIKNNPSAPYINNTLLPMASYAKQYFNPPGNHPSEPNYLWLEAGTNFGIRDDNSPANNHQGTTSHLVSLLNAAGVSWKTYQEDISGTVCPVTDY